MYKEASNWVPFDINNWVRIRRWRLAGNDRATSPQVEQDGSPTK